MRSQPLGSSDVSNLMSYAPASADSQAQSGSGFGNSRFLQTMGPDVGSQLQQSTFGPAPFGAKSTANDPPGQSASGSNDLNTEIDNVITAMQGLMQALMALKQPAGAQQVPTSTQNPPASTQNPANTAPDPTASQDPASSAQDPASAQTPAGSQGAGGNMNSIMKLLEMLIQLITQMIQQMNVNGNPPGGADKSIQDQAALDPSQSQQGA